MWLQELLWTYLDTVKYVECSNTVIVHSDTALRFRISHQKIFFIVDDTYLAFVHFRSKRLELFSVGSRLQWCLDVSAFSSLCILYTKHIPCHWCCLAPHQFNYIYKIKLSNCYEDAVETFHPFPPDLTSFGTILGCYYPHVSLCAFYCTTGSSLLQINESQVCSLEKIPQALACHWLLACLKVTLLLCRLYQSTTSWVLLILLI